MFNPCRSEYYQQNGAMTWNKQFSLCMPSICLPTDNDGPVADKILGSLNPDSVNTITANYYLYAQISTEPEFGETSQTFLVGVIPNCASYASVHASPVSYCDVGTKNNDPAPTKKKYQQGNYQFNTDECR